MRFDDLPGGSYLFERITISNEGDGCEGWVHLGQATLLGDGAKQKLGERSPSHFV
jgi:hypothetical protein